MTYAVPCTRCPNCERWVEDLDGFGVLIHDECGYCSHPDVYGNECRSCGSLFAVIEKGAP